MDSEGPTSPGGGWTSTSLPTISRRGTISNKIRSGTYAVGSAVGSTVGSTLNLAVPQLAGAIDIMVVRQPDGTLKSSPFHGDGSSNFV
mmetsp:Transcript_25202/g.44946  ORF Transcript_25202/g.44946 Transcript_25202/m.44946 type:complete len:88 (+) Transcript_25202:399-662(+)